MSSNEYAFGSAVQYKLLATLIRKPSDTLSLIEPEYFANPMHVDIARIAVKALKGKNLKTDKLTRVSLWELVSVFLKTSKRRDAMARYKQEVRGLYEESLVDRAVLVDLARTFSLEAKSRQTLVEAEKDINAGNHDRAVQRFVELRRTHLSSDSSIKLPIQHLHRFLEEARESDPAAEFVVYPIIPKCGGVLLYGLPKELKSWMGAALAMNVAAGSPKALGFFPITRAARTLYVQIEDTAHMTANRMKMLYEK
jgi:AAA domain